MRAPCSGVALLASLMLLAAPAATAHGPCAGCVRPDHAAPGDKLTIRYPTVRALLNPTRAELTQGPKPYCYGCQLHLWEHRIRTAPSIELGSWPERQNSVRVKVPEVGAGRYLIALFDGSESGDHYTWDCIRVEPGTEGGGGLASPVGISLLGLAFLAAGGIGYLLWRRTAASA